MHEAKIAEIGVLDEIDRLGRPQCDAGVTVVAGFAWARVLLILTGIRRTLVVGMTMAATAVVMSLATGKRDLFDLLVAMGSAMDEPEVARPREDHGQNRHKTDETESPALRGSLDIRPSGWFQGHWIHSSQNDERLIHVHGHPGPSQGLPPRKAPS